jgi:hypothetical protein
VRGVTANDTAGYPPGYSDLASTINPGNIPIGTSSHDSCTGTFNWPCLDGGYFIDGTHNVTVANPWVQELEIVGMYPSSQHIWRLVQHHMKSGYGSITTGNNTVCVSGACSATTSGPHSFSASGTVNTQNGSSGTCTADCVTWVSGTPFQPYWTGTIVINSVSYTISSVKSGTLLQLTTAPGSQSGVAYSWQQVGVRAYNCSNASLNQSGITLLTTNLLDRDHLHVQQRIGDRQRRL